MKTFKALMLCILACATTALHAQWTSEGTGRTYTLQQLAEIPEAGVSFTDGGCEEDYYLISKTLKIIGDTLLIDFNARAADNVSVEVENGGLRCENSLIKDADYVGTGFSIRLTDNTKASVKNSIIEHCGGISLVDASADMENVTFHDFTTDSYYSAVSMMNSTASFRLCEFSFNKGSAIGSAANGNSSIRMDNCIVWANVTDNTNRPQINLGPGTADTIFITNCKIIGYEGLTNVGGISIANLTGNAQTTYVAIDNCQISGNRYGINLQGYNINALITGNKILNNDLEVNPMNGGSGISIYGVDENCRAKLRSNIIKGNLWGITSINKNSIDLGSADDWGRNHIYGNGNNGIDYALYNNASTDITAIGNYWGSNDPSEAENVIFHRPDLGDSYGLVTFEPVMEVHPQLISMSCLKQDNHDENGNCFLDDDLVGFINEYQHTVFLYYDGVLSEHDEFHNLAIRYELGTACYGSPESKQIFQFDDMYQSQLVITTPHGESETWAIQLMETESVTEQEAEKLIITPNPAHEKVYADIDADTHFTVTDITGRMVYEGKADSETVKIDTHNWQSGIYILNATKNGRLAAARIVVK